VRHAWVKRRANFTRHLQGACGVSNPAVVLHRDGSVKVFYRGNNDRGIGVAEAKQWRGPYTKMNNKVSGS
jgi:hypothetical protein